MPTRGPVAATNDNGSGSLTSSNTTQTITLGSVPALGTLLLIGMISPSVGTLNTVSDNASGSGNTWTLLGENQTANGSCHLVGAWVDDRSLTTVTVVFSGAKRIMWSANFFAGSNGGMPQRDLTSGIQKGTGNTSSGPLNSTTWTPGLDPQQFYLLINLVCNATRTTGITPSANFIEITDVGDATVVARFDFAWRCVGNVNNIQFGCTSSGASATCILGIAIPCDTASDQAQPQMCVYRSLPGVLSGSSH